MTGFNKAPCFTQQDKQFRKYLLEESAILLIFLTDGTITNSASIERPRITARPPPFPLKDFPKTKQAVSRSNIFSHLLQLSMPQTCTTFPLAWEPSTSRVTRSSLSSTSVVSLRDFLKQRPLTSQSKPHGVPQIPHSFPGITQTSRPFSAQVGHFTPEIFGAVSLRHFSILVYPTGCVRTGVVVMPGTGNGEAC